MAADYFSAEGEPIISAIIRIFTRKKQLERKSLTIKHLLNAVEAERLDESVIND